MSVKVSIIIPIYNVSPYLSECLDSVLAQTYSDFEVICVDDASSDESGTIIEQYAAKDSRVRAVHKLLHTGTGEARNTGLAMASGEWCLFLDGDDIIIPNALESLSDVISLSNGDVRLIRFCYVEFKHGERCLWPFHEKVAPALVDISREIKWKDFYVYMWEFAYHRDVIGDVVFPAYRRGQDRVFINDIQLYNADSFLQISDVLYGYRQRTGSSVHSLTTKDVLMDELSHRVAIIQAIDNSVKKVVYRRSYWLEQYCLREYLWLAEYSGDYSPDEQRQLVAWFYHELPRICRAKGYSFTGKIKAQLYRVSSRKVWRYLLVIVVPKVEEYLRIFVNPRRLFRGLKRRLHGILH